MKRVLLAMFLVPSLALPAEMAAEKMGGPPDDPMAAWVPPKLKNEAKDKQEITALMKKMEAAGKKGDIEAAAALIDFPVLMTTDDSKGEAMSETWTREQWIEAMTPFYAKPMDMKVTHKPNIFLMSDSLASVDDVCTMTMGGKSGSKSVTMRNNTLLIRKDGEWRVKGMAEGGWGDMMGPQGTASGEAGAASQGTGSGAQESGTRGMGSGTPESKPEGTGTGTQGGAERTTK
jgi:hypothetical protein